MPNRSSTRRGSLRRRPVARQASRVSPTARAAGCARQPRPSARRLLTNGGVLAAILIAAIPNESAAQWLEFRDAKFVARADQPYLIRDWRLADLNGNNRIDAWERLDEVIQRPPMNVRATGRQPSRENPLTTTSNALRTALPADGAANNAVATEVDRSPEYATGESLYFRLSTDSFVGPAYRIYTDYDDMVQREADIARRNLAAEPDDWSFGSGTDLDDFVVLPTSWEAINDREYIRRADIQVAQILTFIKPTNDDARARAATDVLDVSVGLEFNGNREQLQSRGWGGVLGDSGYFSTINRHATGSVVGVQWTRTWRQWRFNLGGSAGLHYSFVSNVEAISIGTNLFPGQFNRPLYFPPLASEIETTFGGLWMQAEAGVRIWRALSPSVQGFAGYDLVQVDDLWLSSASVRGEANFRSVFVIRENRDFDGLASVGVVWQH